MATIFVARLIDHEETWKWMVLAVLGCMNKVYFEKKISNDNTMLDVFIMWKIIYEEDCWSVYD